MKITKRHLRRIIREELNLLSEDFKEKDADTAKEAESDGRKDWEEGSETRESKWESTEYWEDYDLGYNNAVEAAEHEQWSRHQW